jgi:hypothetical protein
MAQERRCIIVMANFDMDAFQSMLAQAGNENLKTSNAALKLMVNEEAQFQTDALGMISADLNAGKSINDKTQIQTSIDSINEIIESNRVNARVKNVGSAATRVLEYKKARVDSSNKVLGDASKILNQINKIRKGADDAPSRSSIEDLVFDLTTTTLNKEFDPGVEADLQNTIKSAQDWLGALQSPDLLSLDDTPNEAQGMYIKKLKQAQGAYSSDPTLLRAKQDEVVNQYISASDEVQAAGRSNDDIANSIKTENLRGLKFNYFKVKSDYGAMKGLIQDDLIKLLGSENSFAEKDMNSIYWVPMIQERLGNVIAASIPEQIKERVGNKYKEVYRKSPEGNSLRSKNNDRAYDPRYITMLVESTVGEHGDLNLGLYGDHTTVPEKGDPNMFNIYKDRYKANQGSKTMSGGRGGGAFTFLGGGKANFEINIWPRVKDAIRDAYSLYKETDGLMPDEELLKIINPGRTQLHTPQSNTDNIPGM